MTRRPLWKPICGVTAGVAFVMAGLAATPAPSFGQEPTRLSDDQVERLLDRIEKAADKYRESLDDALDESRVDDSRLEDQLNRFVQEFENATDRLERRFDDDKASGEDVREVLTRAASINGLMTQFEFTERAQGDWRLLRNDLNELARAYNVVWEWVAVPRSPR